MLSLMEVFQEAQHYAGGLPASYSRMNTLLRCPLAFVLRYQKQVKLPKLPKSDALVIGKNAHWIMEQSVSTAYKCRDFSLDGAEYGFYFNHVADRAPEEHRELYWELLDPMARVLERLFRVMAFDGAEVATEKCLRLDPRAMPVRSTAARYPKNKRPPLGYLGYIDLELRWKDRMYLFDYKTELPTEARHEEVIKQTGMYAYMEFLQYQDLNDINTYCIYLKDATFDKVATYNRKRDFAKLENSVLATFNQYLEALRMVEPVARENRYCEYCDFRVAGLCTLKRRWTGETTEEGDGTNCVEPGA